MLEPVLKNIVLRGEPENISDFVIGANADIGIDGHDGVEYFYFRMITPKRIIKFLNEDKIVDGRATFIVNELDMESNIKLVESYINKILEDCVRESWIEVAKAINRYLEWEYDNIQYETLEEGYVKINEKNKLKEDGSRISGT
jgi:hypothetical protein